MGDLSGFHSWSFGGHLGFPNQKSMASVCFLNFLVKKIDLNFEVNVPIVDVDLLIRLILRTCGFLPYTCRWLLLTTQPRACTCNAISICLLAPQCNFSCSFNYFKVVDHGLDDSFDSSILENESQ